MTGLARREGTFFWARRVDRSHSSTPSIAPMRASAGDARASGARPPLCTALRVDGTTLRGDENRRRTTHGPAVTDAEAPGTRMALNRMLKCKQQARGAGAEPVAERGIEPGDEQPEGVAGGSCIPRAMPKFSSPTGRRTIAKARA